MLWKKKKQKEKDHQKAPEVTKHTSGRREKEKNRTGGDMAGLKKLEERIDEKISLLMVLDERAGRKIEALEKLLYSSMASKPDAVRINRSDEILALKDKGLDALDISEILSVPIGEVELILNLNKKNQQ